MANYNYTMEELVRNSIRVTPDTIVVYPQFAQEGTANVSEIVPKFPGRYAMNNSTVAFVYNNSFYVTPYTRQAMNALKANKFREDSFCVPFSNWDYPKNEYSKWSDLLQKAHKSYEEDFVDDCEKFCDKHDIGVISEETLKNCFMIPDEGVKVRRLYYENCYYPTIRNYCLDCNTAEKLGTYCTNNGRVVFVYRDGHTYVTKRYRIISELREAGYRETGMFVPFSNGEEILDPDLREKWESISK